MKEKIRKLNNFAEFIKNDNKIDCTYYIKKTHQKYEWAFKVIDNAINFPNNTLDDEFINSIKIIKNVVEEAKNELENSKTGFSAYEGQDRNHVHALRYLSVSKIKNIICFDKNEKKIYKLPINENTKNLDIDNLKLVKLNYIISLEICNISSEFDSRYEKFNENYKIIKLEIFDENINGLTNVNEFDFIVNADFFQNNDKKIYCIKTTGYAPKNYKAFQNYNLKNVEVDEEIINCNNDAIFENIL